MTQQQLPWLGEPENHRTAFMAAKALANAAAIGRQVVAFLNGRSDAVLWIGVGKDQEGCAESIEPVHAQDVAELENQLADTIHPAFPADCVQVQQVAYARGVVVRIRIKPGPQPPYAQFHQGGWRFVRRLGPRVESLEFHQIESLFRERFAAETQAAAPDIDEAVWASYRLAELRTHDLESRRCPHLWVSIAPVCTDSTRERQPAWNHPSTAELLMNPQATGNRDAGWTFANPYRVPEQQADWVRDPATQPMWTQQVGQTQRLYLFADGSVTFAVGLERLTSANLPKLLSPIPLAELVTSVFRLLRTALATSELFADKPAAWLAEASLVGAVGWKLAVVDPQRYPLVDLYATQLEDGEADHLTTGPRRITAAQVQESPDRCACTLVRELYVQWGYLPGDVKLDVFDAASGALLVG